MDPIAQPPAVDSCCKIASALDVETRTEQPSASPTMQRLVELELENQRLQSLVAELLFKNQLLRAGLRKTLSPTQPVAQG